MAKDIGAPVFGEGELGSTRLLFIIQIILVVFPMIFEAANIKTPDVNCPGRNVQRPVSRLGGTLQEVDTD
jgi:hypothetical protein